MKTLKLLETKSEILEEAYRSNEYDTIIENICKKKPHYFDDLKQETFIMLFEKPDSLILDLYKENKLIAYFTRIAYIQIISNKSKFHYLYRKHNDDLCDDMSIIPDTISFDDELLFKDSFDIYEYTVKNKLLTWYELELFNVYYRIYPSFLCEDISEKISYFDLEKLMNTTKTVIYKKMCTIRYKLFKCILNDKSLINKIPDNNKSFMQNFIAKIDLKTK